MKRKLIEYTLFFSAIISLIFLSSYSSFVSASTEQNITWNGDGVDYKFVVRMDEKYCSWYQLYMEIEWDTDGYIVVAECHLDCSKSWNGYSVGYTGVLWGIQGDSSEMLNPGCYMDGWYKLNPWAVKDIDQYVCLWRYESTPYFCWCDEHTWESIPHSSSCASFIP